MLTETAKNDLAALRAAGFKPTDEEVVKLNDLAIRIEKGKETTPANMPRVAFAGNVVLHEPTVGALEWWNDFGRDAAYTSNGRLMTYFFMLANARNLDYLLTLQKPKDVRVAVRKWKKTVDATQDELWRAMMWAKYGAEDMQVDLKQKVETSMDDDAMMDMMWLKVIMSAGAIGVLPNDLKTHTMSELIGSLIQASMLAHLPIKQSVAKDYIAYRQIMRQIEDRYNTGKEVENG